MQYNNNNNEDSNKKNIRFGLRALVYGQVCLLSI